MFGYVRPLKGELKVSEFEEFRAVYCGFCNALGKRYGVVSRFLLNYDFAFLALVLFSISGKTPSYEHKRCIASPFRKKCALMSDESLNLAADICVILSWWKLQDSVKDEGFFGSLKSRFLMVLLYRAYKKAARLNPVYDETVRVSLSELSSLEENKVASIDRPADTFARILEKAATGIQDEKVRRPAAQMFYHVGRWIYIMDACNDLEEDFKKDGYNPVALRYSLKKGEGLEKIKDSLDFTAAHSISYACSALELLDLGSGKAIIYNILNMGMPFGQQRVLENSWGAKDMNKTRGMH